ncbi:hypothetical protein OMCYN_00804 [cyanobiont of Ornithocercus magnificus]|nr:hypothetical protein OMCYN_00804 [cyanobiont of Ornithocercus magnificus]
MSDQFIPDALSHKDLAKLLNTAAKESVVGSTEQEDRVSLTTDWEARIKAVLEEVTRQSKDAAEGKTVDQVMALGSFRTHLMLSLQALRAADKN